MTKVGQSTKFKNTIKFDIIEYDSTILKYFSSVKLKKETQQLHISGKSKRLPADLIKRAIRRLEYIHYARPLNNLLVPPSNRRHSLRKDNIQFRSMTNGEFVSVSKTAMPMMLK